MVWSDKLKLNKQIAKSITDEGMLIPKDLQLKTLSRISGGQDIIAIAPEGSGKTTTCILSALNKFRQGLNDAPRVLMLVADKDRVLHVLEEFNRLNKNNTIQIAGLYPALGMEAQLNALADGADIVVATPDRARAIYLKLALNLNKIQLLIIDDADLIVKQGMQLPVAELANSITKCQHLIFTEVIHSRLSKMIEPFMNEPCIIELEPASGQAIVTHEQILYEVPNFRTKLNLLNLFLEDADLFTKVMVIAGSAQTADKIYESLKRPVQTETMLFKQQHATGITANSIGEFIPNAYRVLIAVNDTITVSDVKQLPFVIHFDLPEDKEQHIARIANHHPGKEAEQMNILFATDLELGIVKKIEQATGAKIPLGELPEELKIETATLKKTKPAEKEELAPGAAFHIKKPSNAKTRNYSSGEKARMTKKKKHG